MQSLLNTPIITAIAKSKNIHVSESGIDSFSNSQKVVNVLNNLCYNTFNWHGYIFKTSLTVKLVFNQFPICDLFNLVYIGLKKAMKMLGTWIVPHVSETRLHSSWEGAPQHSLTKYSRNWFLQVSLAKFGFFFQ